MLKVPFSRPSLYLSSSKQDGSHLDDNHPMKRLKPNSSDRLPMTYMGAGGKAYRIPKPIQVELVESRPATPEEEALFFRLIPMSRG